MSAVTFLSDGLALAGTLHLPPDYREGARLPGAVVVGSLTSVKEMNAGNHAKALAARGFAALAFDYRNFGESEGPVPFYESPEEHVRDVRHAFAFLAGHPAVDPDRLVGHGVCTGTGYMARAVAEGVPARALGLAALWMPNDASDYALYGGDEGLRAKREAAATAREKVEAGGHVPYLLAYGNRPNDPAAVARASHNGPMEYYFDCSRGCVPEWTNRFAVASWEGWLRHRPIEAAPRIAVPTLVAHSDNAALPDNARAFYDALGGPKDLRWSQDAHFDFYDRPDLVASTADAAAAHYRRALENS